MPHKVYSTNESGFTEIFFLSNGYTLKDTICSFTDFATELLFSCKLQNSQPRKNIAFENIFKFNSTCPVVNWVIHLWIGKLLNDNWINVNSVKSSRFPLIYITSGFGLGVHTMQKAEVRVMGGKRQAGGRKFNKILSAREAGRSLGPPPNYRINSVKC